MIEKRNYNKAILLRILIVFAVFIFSLRLGASNLKSNLEEELSNYLESIQAQTPTMEEQFPEHVVVILYEKEGQEKPNAFVIPLHTAQRFEYHLFSKRKFDELFELSEFVLKGKEDAVTYDMLAKTYELLGETGKAIETYNKAIDIEPDNKGMPYFRLWGIYAYDKKDVRMADEYFQKFSYFFNKSSKEDKALAKEYLVDTLMDEGLYFLNELIKPDKAVKYFKMVLELEPEYERAKLNLALSRFAKSIELKDMNGSKEIAEELKMIKEKSKDPRVISVINGNLEVHAVRFAIDELAESIKLKDKEGIDKALNKLRTIAEKSRNPQVISETKGIIEKAEQERKSLFNED
jgi:tetratricopeptide (TPR) repeat protein